MPRDETEIKVAKAKLYNLKSAVEGLITMVDSSVMEPDQAMKGVVELATKMFDEYQQQVGGGHPG